MSILHRNPHGASLVQSARRKLTDVKDTVKSQVLSSHPEAGMGRGKPYPSLSPPLVTLFVAPSAPKQSEEAFQILVASRTAFRVEDSTDGTISARFAGKTQHGIEGVKNLRDGLLSMRRILLEPSDELAADLKRRHRPGLKEHVERQLAEYTCQARVELDRILAQTSAQ